MRFARSRVSAVDSCVPPSSLGPCPSESTVSASRIAASTRAPSSHRPPGPRRVAHGAGLHPGRLRRGSRRTRARDAGPSVGAAAHRPPYRCLGVGALDGSERPLPLTQQHRQVEALRGLRPRGRASIAACVCNRVLRDACDGARHERHGVRTQRRCWPATPRGNPARGTTPARACRVPRDCRGGAGRAPSSRRPLRSCKVPCAGKVHGVRGRVDAPPASRAPA